MVNLRSEVKNRSTGDSSGPILLLVKFQVVHMPWMNGLQCKLSMQSVSMIYILSLTIKARICGLSDIRRHFQTLRIRRSAIFLRLKRTMQVAHLEVFEQSGPTIYWSEVFRDNQ